MEYNISFITGSPPVAVYSSGAEALGHPLTKVCPEDCGRWPTLPDTFPLLPVGTTHLQMDPLCYHELSEKHNRRIMCWNWPEITRAISAACVLLLCHRRCSSPTTVFIENYFSQRRISGKILADNDTQDELKLTQSEAQCSRLLVKAKNDVT